MTEKTALVTGAGRGIGRAIALRLGQAGYNVGVHFNASEEGALAVCKTIEEAGRKAVTLQANLQNIDEIDTMFERFLETFGHIDLLVNNSGVTRFAPFLETTEELWDEVVGIDFKGAYFCAQRVARKMVEQGTKGSIVNITSNQQEGRWPRASVYGPTKAAEMKFTEHAALELARHGIRVNAVAPGYTVDCSPEEQTRETRITQRLPLARLVHPNEVADAVVYLASNAAVSITGTCLKIDAGSLLPVLTENDFV